MYSSVHNSGRAAYFGRAIIALVWAIRAMMLLAATPAIIAGVALP